ncbi:MAG: narX [Fluviicola sp.]|jgi:PAS domain S-box-containing protein|uniref:SpoIIE family protein phosphatase n=1 Tax=Fluviicola sp. TaxID=1917219 RepID=UPI0026151582|nr:SpoIIE family protein phosphatase [Fluviicola sp.]MDF3026824.1 narX [Fluviicola sp.]
MFDKMYEGRSEAELKQIITEYERSLRIEKRYQETLNHMMEGFQIIDFDWRYLYVNDTVVRHSKTSREVLLGKTLLEVFPQLEDSQLHRSMKKCMENRVPEQFENKMEYADGTSAWFRLSIQPVPEGICVLSMEITQLKKAEEDLRRLNDVLDQKVKIRTSILAEKNNEIMDSINYAQKIQQCFLPTERDFTHHFPQSFIFFQPKDVVSGDFYWLKNVGNKTIFAMADCTGHGVPGALISIIGATVLNDISCADAPLSAILQDLNRRIKEALKSENDDSLQDGMDIALCSYDPAQSEIEFTGANRPLWLVRKGSSDLEEFCSTRVPIGGYTSNNQEFISHKISLSKGDTFYLASDGYADQDGGERGKKFKTKNFKQLLAGMQLLPMSHQKKHLENFAETWRAGREQLDDMLVIGIRI